SGDVVVAGVGRRTITTANAYQKMVLPYYGGLSAWNSFVRQYTDDLQVPKYSSLVVGAWDTLTQAGGGNTELYGVYKTVDGIVAVGRHTADATSGLANGNAIPLANVPTWGSNAPASESAILVYYTAQNIINNGDGFVPFAVTEPSEKIWSVYPNPAIDALTVRCSAGATLTLRNALGQFIERTHSSGTQTTISIEHLPAGVYTVEVDGSTKRWVKAR
ncbi:MAG: T9SS type A sorting domain-containing protein, partial [Flavobacteriales bacterium]